VQIEIKQHNMQISLGLDLNLVCETGG